MLSKSSGSSLHSTAVPIIYIVKLSTLFRSFIVLLFGLMVHERGLGQPSPPNILLIIADDLGVDVTNGYHSPGLSPNTPTLDSLMASGLTFNNVWSTPMCTPTRAAIMSGKYGIKTGVLSAPGNLDISHVSLLRAVDSTTQGQYADAVIGKWHISQPTNPNHPNLHGADYFMGVIGAAVGDYYTWDKTEDGVSSIENSYVTEAFTNTTINWITQQTQPWLTWLAHVAPHSPNHVPPAGTYSISNPTTNFRRYIAMIESLDYEIGRLINGIPDSIRDNTIVIYVGDNGTPNNFLQDYPDGHGKSTLYQGGIRVPMIISGVGVTRMGERENALVHVCDLYATILELTGAKLQGGIYNSLSFAPLLRGDPSSTRLYNYSEINDDWTIRNQQYKLIQYADGTQEFYDLLIDSLETTDLINGLSSEQESTKNILLAEAEQIRNAWSCQDNIKNGDEDDIDCGGSYCAACATTADSDVQNVQFSIFPNPVRNQLTISGDLSQYTLEIVDINGQRYKLINTTEQSQTVDITGLPPGIYVVKLIDDIHQTTWTELIVKQ